MTDEPKRIVTKYEPCEGDTANAGYRPVAQKGYQPTAERPTIPANLTPPTADSSVQPAKDEGGKTDRK